MAKWKKPNREESRALRQQLSDRARSGTLRYPAAIGDIRRSIGMTQQEFANLLGMTRRQIADMERDAANPTLDTLNKVGRLFGFTVGLVPMEDNAIKPSKGHEQIE